MRTLPLALLFTLTVHAAQSFAEDKPANDPSGTWRWTSDVRDATINSRLHLKNDDGKVTGTYSNDDIDVEIEDATFDGKKLSLGFEFDRQGNTITVQFEGVPSKDTIEGKINIDIDIGGQTMNFDWTAKRATENSDVVGSWELKIERPDGEAMTPTLTLEDKEGKLSGTYDAEVVGELDVSDIGLKKNKLTWTVETDYDGSDIILCFTGTPRGSTIAGTVEYNFGGQTGEIDFTGKLKPAKKKE